MISLNTNRGSFVQHPTFELALREATRLAEKENTEVFILGVVASVKPIPRPTNEIKFRT